MSRVELSGATRRDLAYIGSRLRPEDHDEIAAQYPGYTAPGLAEAHLHGYAYIASVDGNPEAAFGATEVRRTLWVVWAWGSPAMWRCASRIADFGRKVVLPQVYADGATRAEARTLITNNPGNRMLAALGATRRCELPGYGVQGETFVLWDWTRDTVDEHHD